MRGWKVFTGAAFAAGMIIGAGVGPAAAADETHRVIETTLHDGYPSSPSANDPGWYREDTRPGGGAILVKTHPSFPGTISNPNDGPGGAPGFGDGSLALTTNSQTGAASGKAQLITYDDVLGLPLATVNGLSYWTYRSRLSGTANDDASYQLRVDIDGDFNTTNDQTNLVYEPYYNGTITPDQWEFQDASAGDWWSSKTITCPGLTVTGTAGGPPSTRPSEVGLHCPGAKVISIGVNVGSNNPNYIVAVDGVRLTTLTDSFTWDFGPGPK